MFTLLHTESSKGWGGQEHRILKESLGLKKLGVRVIILCQPDSNLAVRAAEAGIEVQTCRMRKSYDLFAIQYMTKVIKSEDIQIVSTHSGRDSFLAGLAGRLSRRRPRIVRTRHIALPITSRVSYSILPHMVVTTSEYVRQYLIGEGIRPDRVVAVPTGVDTGIFDPSRVETDIREELKVGSTVPLVATIAILRFRKGHHTLLDSIPTVLKEIPEARFLIIGDGPQQTNIQEKIKEMGLTDTVLMLGLRHDIPEILKAIDLCVLPTLQESLPQALLQAKAMEKPVIGTDVGGVGEAVKDGICGRLVRAGNHSALANVIIEILLDREKALKMGKEGRKVVEQNFTVEAMSKKMFDLYSSLCEGTLR